MSTRCMKLGGQTLVLCETARTVTSTGLVEIQVLRNTETRQARQQLAIKRGRQYASLRFCPWCGASIDTTQENPHG